MNGGAGNDNFTGSTDNDNYIVDSGTDNIADCGTGRGNEVIITAGAVANATVSAANIVTATSIHTGTLNATADGLANNTLVSFSALAGINGATITGNNNGLQLTGSAQSDTVTGGTVQDTISGGAGNDQLSGGINSDTFIIGGITANTITDVSQGVVVLQGRSFKLLELQLLLIS